MASPRILVLGAWDDGPGYPRTRSLLQALAAAGHAPALWRLPPALPGRGRAEAVARPWRWPGLARRLLAARRRAPAAVAAALAEVRPDLVLVPYPGHLLVRAVRAAFAGPVVLDLFLPAYDTVVEDRRLFRPGSLPARALRALDRRACAAADLVLLDTPAHAARAAALVGLPAERFGWVPVGDPEAPPAPAPYAAPAPGSPLRVLFFGTGVPLHGLPVLVGAAARCGGAVRLLVIGGSRRERDAVARLACPHVELGPAFLPRPALQERIDRAHLVAGVFGTSAKTQRVVPFKVVHALAAGRPVLTGDTEAVRAWLQPGTDVLVAPVGDESALAACLAELARRPQPLPGLARAARAAYERCFAPAALAARLEAVLAGLLSPSPAPRISEEASACPR
jgi:glycosyltransferase involved in cell wall biosynthesis